MKTLYRLFVAVLCIFFLTNNSFGQDSLKINSFLPKKNVIRYNITPHIVGFKSAIFGYERVVKPYQTFSVNAGFIAIGKSGTSENEEFEITRTKSTGGFTVAGDYRFYLKRENRDSAPHGVYIGPYYAFYNFFLDNQLQHKSSGDYSSFDTNFFINSLGVEIGYQFVIKNRFTIDMVFIGPSYSSYKLNMALTGNLEIPEGELNERLEALRDILFAKYPWMKTLVDENEIDFKGKSTHWGLGFRYVIQIGYRF